MLEPEGIETAGDGANVDDQLAARDLLRGLLFEHVLGVVALDLVRDGDLNLEVVLLPGGLNVRVGVEHDVVLGRFLDADGLLDLRFQRPDDGGRQSADRAEERSRELATVGRAGDPHVVAGVAGNLVVGDAKDAAVSDAGRAVQQQYAARYRAAGDSAGKPDGVRGGIHALHRHRAEEYAAEGGPDIEVLVILEAVGVVDDDLVGGGRNHRVDLVCAAGIADQRIPVARESLGGFLVHAADVVLDGLLRRIRRKLRQFGVLGRLNHANRAQVAVRHRRGGTAAERHPVEVADPDFVAKLDFERNTRRAVRHRLHVGPLFDPFPESRAKKRQGFEFRPDEFLLERDVLSYSALRHGKLLNVNSGVLAGPSVRRPSRTLLTLFG